MKTIETEVECCRECPYFDKVNRFCPIVDEKVEDITSFLDNCPFD